MLTIVLEWIYYICCMVCVVLAGEWTFQWTVREWKRFVGAGIIYLLTIATQYISVSEMIPMFIVLFVGEFISWALLCKGKVREKIFPMLGVYYGVSLLELIIRVVLDLVTKSLLLEELSQLIAIIIAFFILAIVTKTNPYKNFVLYFKSISKAKSVIIWALIIIGMLMVTFSMAVQMMLDNEVISMIFRGLMIVELCVVVTIVIWLVMESYQKKYYLEQNNLKEEIIHSQQNYYQTIYEKDKEMRSFRHDMASQLEMFKILLENSEIEKLKEHFESMQRDFNRASFSKIYVGNDVLDAIISMMNQKAQEKGIQVDVAGRIEYTKDYGIYDLCAIFSNAINNAIEACERINSKGPISIKLMTHNQTLCCVFQNPGTEEMYQNIWKGETGKADIINHGYGVRNIKRVVERLGGNMEYRYDAGRIILEIYI